MRKALSVFIAVCLVLSLCTGVFAPVPEAKAAGPAVVDLGTAGNFAILAKTGISTIVGTVATSVYGDIGISPAPASALTGFGQTMDASNTFSTSTSVIAPGKLYASDYAPPTPINTGIAVGDMYTAYNQAAGRTGVEGTDLFTGQGASGDIGGVPFYPHIYKWSTDVTIPTDITIWGGPDDVFIFQIAGTLEVAADVRVLLANMDGGAPPLAKNIFWQVAGAVSLLERSHFEGNILAQTNIALEDGASINGRLLAQTAVTLIGNDVSAPANTTYTVTPSVVGNGTVTLNGIVTLLPQTVAEGLYATVTINAAPGSWIATGGLVDSADGVIAAADHLQSYTYTTITPVTGNRTIDAIFEPFHTVTASVIAGNGTTVPATQRVAEGLYATVTITAASGSWIKTGGLVDSVDGVIAAANHQPIYTYTTTPVTADRTIGATFEAFHTVTASVIAGNGTTVPATQTVAEGLYATVTITATPGSWIATGGLVDSVDGVIAAANHLTTYTYTTTPVTADRTIGATFEAIPIYTLTVNKVGNGTVTPATGTTYASGAVVPLTATPAAGYTFTGWSGDLGGATSPTTLIMNADKAVTATFAANSYANPSYILTYTPGTHGTITGTTPQTVGYGASGTPVTAVPNAGYHFVSWSDGSTVNPRTDRNVTANKAVIATFAANPVTPLPNALGLNPLTLPLQICRESEIVVDESWTNGTAPFTWTVNFGDGTPVVTGSSTDRRLVVRHLYAAEGSYTVNVAVTDSSGQVGSASHTLEAVICSVPGEVYHHTFFIGYPDGLFKPERNVSRAEVAAALTRALGLGWSNTKPSYPDVPATHWSSGNIQIMKAEGIMIGDVSGTFRPDAFITRAETATLLLRMLKVAPFNNLTSSSFKDVSATNWAIGYIESMQKYGLITGYPDGTYKPNAHILRSEFTAIADRALGREISKSSQVTGLGKDIRWPDVPVSHWAYLYILEASTPHTVEQVNRLNRNIVLKSKTIPLLSDGTSAVTIRKVGDHLTAIVPVDGLLPNGSIPAARKVTVVITIKLKP